VNKGWKQCLMGAALVAALSPMMAMADGRLGRINQRERQQQQRIREGIRDGELTRREAGRLQVEQAQIRLQEARARRSGGEFTARERLRIQRELNQSSRHIYRQKHDRQDRD
jgi:hypothetical protein